MIQTGHSQLPNGRGGGAGRAFAGFRWLFELPSGQVFDEPVALALRDAFTTAAAPHARAMDIPYVAVQFALLGESIVRIKSSLSRASSLVLPISPLGVTSGRVGYVLLSAWPRLQSELARRGIRADGPAQSAMVQLGSPAADLRARLFFDPGDVSQYELAISWDSGPPETALELGRVDPGGVTMAGI
jgi:hypothetical protein